MAAKNIPTTFDFDFEGDILAGLDALGVVQPQLEIMPPSEEGLRVVPVPISVHLKQATLEDALQAIGEQGGDVASVIKRTSIAGTTKVFIQFRQKQ